MNYHIELKTLKPVYESILNLQEIENVINHSPITKGYSPNKDHNGLFYYNSTQTITDLVKSYLPDSLAKTGEVSFCKIIGGIVPHRDHDCKSKINIYLRAGSARTVFFKDPGYPGKSFHNDDRHNIYNYKEDNLRVSETFIANDNEVYLLDTSCIHCVILPPNEYRIIVSISFDEEYVNVLEQLS